MKVTRLSPKRIATLLPIIFIFHNLEEGLTMQRWIYQHLRTFPAFFADTIQVIPRNQFAEVLTVALALSTVIPLIIAVAFMHNSSSQALKYLFQVTLGIMLINGIQHVCFSFFFREYTPGVATAFVFNIPFSLYALSRLNTPAKRSFYGWGTFLVMTIVVYVSMLAGIWLVSLLVV